MNILAAITVLIIDTGLSSKNINVMPWVNSYDTIVETDDNRHHGPGVTNIILSDQQKDWVCPTVKVDVCNIYGSKYMNCLKKALDNKYDYVNISLSGSVLNGEKELLQAITKKSTVIVAAGNDGDQILRHYPAAYHYEKWDNFYVITNYKHSKSNIGFGTIDIDGVNIKTRDSDNRIIYMTGTSMSAARYTHQFIKRSCNGY